MVVSCCVILNNIEWKRLSQNRTCSCSKGLYGFFSGKKRSETGGKRHVETSYKINLSCKDNKHTEQVEESSRQLVEMKKRKLEEREKKDYESMTNFENHFKDTTSWFDWDEYHKDFSNPIYDEIYVDWCSVLIYGIYFDDDYVDNNIIYNENNCSDNDINNILIDN